MVAINCFLLIELVRTRSLASDTGARVHLRVLHTNVVGGSFEIAALAPEVNFEELGEDLGPFGYYTAEFNESVKVKLAEITEFVFDGEVTDSNENLWVDLRVGGVEFSYYVSCYFV